MDQSQAIVSLIFFDPYGGLSIRASQGHVGKATGKLLSCSMRFVCFRKHSSLVAIWRPPVQSHSTRPVTGPGSAVRLAFSGQCHRTHQPGTRACIPAHPVNGHRAGWGAGADEKPDGFPPDHTGAGGLAFNRRGARWPRQFPIRRARPGVFSLGQMLLSQPKIAAQPKRPKNA